MPSNQNALKSYKSERLLLNNKLENNNKLNQYSDDNTNIELKQQTNYLNKNIVPVKRNSLNNNNIEETLRNKPSIQRHIIIPLPQQQKLERTERNDILSLPHSSGNKMYQIQNINDIGWFRFGRR